MTQFFREIQHFQHRTPVLFSQLVNLGLSANNPRTEGRFATLERLYFIGWKKSDEKVFVWP